MVEEQRARVDEAMTKMIDDVDKTYLRALQAKMFKCAAACCEDKDGSINSVQRCIQTCGVPFQSAQNYVHQELDHLQERLQRCIMTCNDSIRDKMGPGSSDTEMSKYLGEFEDCAKKCVDSHLGLIPNTLKKIKELFKRKDFQSITH